MKLHLLLAIGLVMAAGWVVGAGAQEKAGEARKEDVSPKVLAALKGLLPELAEKWSAYKKGIRPLEDGYVIIDRLRDELLLSGKGTTTEFQEVDRHWRRLLIKNQNFRSSPPKKLSDEVQPARIDPKQERRLLELKAARFEPIDDRVIGVYSRDRRVAIEYQFRLEFAAIPPQFSSIRKAYDTAHELVGVRTDGTVQPLSRDVLAANKILSFQRRIRIKEAPSSLLVCSYFLMGYTANASEEKRVISLKGHSRFYPWVNRSGEFADFCGIVGFDGNIVYKFPFSQMMPNKLLEPLKLSADGKWAAVMVGEKKTYMEGENGFSIGYPSEVLVWEAPDKFKKIPAREAPAEIRELSGAFLQKKNGR